MPKISVIIPTLNEAELIEGTLVGLAGARQVECLVVDGGSRDDTPQRVRRLGIPLLEGPRGRALQMNLGARRARGEILLFLHADTLLPAGFQEEVQRLLKDPWVVAGAFRLRIEGRQPSLRLVEAGANLRSLLLRLPYGDQALFLRARTFHELGGFAPLPILEDYELIRRLRRRGRIAISPLAVQTSGRRWQRLGVWKTTWLNQQILIGYALGVPPERLLQWYGRGGTPGNARDCG